MTKGNRERKAFWGTVGGYFSTVATILVQLALAPIVLKYVSREDYGIWLAASQAMTYVGLAELGTSMTVTRYIAGTINMEEKIEFQEVVSSSLVIFSVVALIVLVAGSAMVYLVPIWLKVNSVQISTIYLMLSILLLWMVLNSVLHVFFEILMGAQEVAFVNILGAISNISTVIFTIVFLKLNLGIVSLALGVLASFFLRTVIGWAKVRQVVPHLRLSMRFATRSRVRELCSFSLWTFLQKAGSTISSSADSLIIGRLLGPAAITVYSMTGRLSQTMQGLISRLSHAMLPGLAEMWSHGDHDGIVRWYEILLRSLLATGLLGILFLSVFNESFVTIWVGVKNYGGTSLTLLFGMVMMYQALMTVTWNLLTSTGKIETASKVTVAEAVVNIALAVVLTRRMGISGMTAAVLLSGLFTSGWYQLLQVHRILSLTWRFYLCVFDLRMILFVLVLSLTHLLAPRPHGWYGIVFEGIALSALMLVPILFLGFGVFGQQVTFRSINNIKQKLIAAW